MKQPSVDPPVVLAAHGSRDPRSARTMRTIASAVARRHGGAVSAAFLEFNSPSVPSALRSVAAGGVMPIVVPALLTNAYHRRVDIPEVIAASGVPARVSDVLGPAELRQPPHPLLLGALLRRLGETRQRWDALVLVAAGTTRASARSTVESVAAALGRSCDVVCSVGYASASGPSPGEAIARLQERGATRVAVVPYFLAPGRLYDAAATSARRAGAIAVAAPLGAARELVELVAHRIAATGVTATAASAAIAAARARPIVRTTAAG